LPYDFFAVVAFRFYLDSVAENLVNIEKGASKPPKYVTHTPVLFDVWSQWYDALPYPQHEKTQESIEPLGEKNIPEEFKDEFSGLEEFYQHYINLTKEV
jgi:hypothetical protein